jgi:hypothetical protein
VSRELDEPTILDGAEFPKGTFKIVSKLIMKNNLFPNNVLQTQILQHKYIRQIVILAHTHGSSQTSGLWCTL